MLFWSFIGWRFFFYIIDKKSKQVIGSRIIKIIINVRACYWPVIIWKIIGVYLLIK